MQQHPYWNKQKPIHPDISEVRKEAEHSETEQEKKIRLAKIGEALKREGKRIRYEAKHKPVEPDPYKVNIVDGVRLGRKDAKEAPRNERGVTHYYPDIHFGRISKQCEALKSGVRAGYTDAMKDYERAHGRKSTRDKPGKANPVVVMELERKKKLNGKRDTERDAFY